MNAFGDWTDLHIGDVAGCYFLTTTRTWIGPLAEHLRDALVGRLLWVTSIDSGPFILTPKELKEGWSAFEQLAVSPVLTLNTDLHAEEYTEWWVDAQEHRPLRDTEFCNYVGFPLAGLAARPWDNTTPHLANLARLQQRFWMAFWESKSEMYFGCGDLLNFVCRDRATFDRALEFVTRQPKGT